MKELKKFLKNRDIKVKEIRNYKKEGFFVIITDRIYLQDLIDLSRLTNDKFIGIYSNEDNSIKIIVDVN